MTVSGLMQTAMDLVSEFESTAGAFLDEVLTVTAPFLSWADENDAAAQGYWVEITQGTGFDDAIRIFTTGTAFDVDGSAGLFSGRAALSGSDSAEGTMSAPDAISSFISRQPGMG